ncbi:hypothetical protein DFH29DRAFT_870891 [Suillus ampliporus]|nr:hypothetical protein DFH29DRAFT_870891 [Suillus ampliporus]
MGDYFPDSIGLQTVALFDFGITFDSEVCLAWGRKWEVTRIAFIVSRYLPFVGLAMTVYYSVESTHGGIVSLLLRSIAVAVLVISTVDALKSGDSTRGVFEQGRDASIIYGLLMFVELVQISLTLYKHFKSYRLEGSPLANTLCRDGVIYLLCITLMSMANCISIVTLPSSYTALLAGLSQKSPQLVVHSVLASRILFNIRAMFDLQGVVTNELLVSGVAFPQFMAFQTRSFVDHAERCDLTAC